MNHSPEHAQARSPVAIQSAFPHTPPSRPQALVLWRLHRSLVLLCGQSKLLPFGQEVSEPRERQEKGTEIENRALEARGWAVISKK